MMSPPWKAEKRPMTRSNSGGFFFGCFRPVVADRDDRLVRSRSTPLKGRDEDPAVLAYIAFDDDGKGVDGLQRGGCRAEDADHPQKEGTSVRLVRATKAAFHEMSLVRKVRKKRNSKKMEEPNGHLCKKADRILRLTSERSAGKNDSWEEPGKSDFDVSTSSRSSVAAASLSCTGSASSLSPGSSSNSLDCGPSKLWERRASSKPMKTGQAMPLLFILLALALLIFWGKVCAILCTSVCLVFSLSSWARAHQSATWDDESFRSADYKKRVVMEGLLSRQRRPRGPQRWSSPSS